MKIFLLLRFCKMKIFLLLRLSNMIAGSVGRWAGRRLVSGRCLVGRWSVDLIDPIAICIVCKTQAIYNE